MSELCTKWFKLIEKILHLHFKLLPLPVNCERFVDLYFLSCVVVNSGSFSNKIKKYWNVRNWKYWLLCNFYYEESCKLTVKYDQMYSTCHLTCFHMFLCSYVETKSLPSIMMIINGSHFSQCFVAVEVRLVFVGFESRPWKNQPVGLYWYIQTY